MLITNKLDRLIKHYLLIIIAILIGNCYTYASGNSDIVINTSTTSNGDWSFSGGIYTFTPSANSVNIKNSDITNLIAGSGAVGNGSTGITSAGTNGVGDIVILTSCSGTGSQTGNITTAIAATAVSTSTTQLSFTITAAGSISLTHSFTFSSPSNASTGYPAPNITLTAPLGISFTSITSRGGITSGNFIAGKGGNVTITSASGSVTSTGDLLVSGRSGSNIGTSSHAGAGGNISITGTSLNVSDLLNDGGICSTNGNGGNGGNITLTSTATSITTADLLNDGGDVSGAGGTGGNAGNVTLLASTNISITLAIRAQGGIGGTSAAGGNGAEISLISTSGSIAITGTCNSKGGTSTIYSGSAGGNANFTAGTSITLSGALGTASDGFATAGNVNMTASNGAISLVSINATGYPAGNVTLTASTGITFSSFLKALGTASAVANGGAGGTVILNANNGDIVLSSLLNTYGGDASTGNFSGGTAGNITLTAVGSIKSSATINAYAGASSGSGTANAGSVNLTGSLGSTINEDVNTTSSSGTVGSFTCNDGASTVTSGNGANDGQITAKVISGGAYTKTGSGTFQFLGTNTYTGITTISNGTLQIGASGVIPDASNVVLDGGTLNTGSTVGFSETAGTLTLSSNSGIALGTGAHNLAFAISNGTTWSNTSTLTITQWQGAYNGTSGTSGKIFTGASAELSGAKLARIAFINPSNGLSYTATQLGTGEIVPTAVLPVIFSRFEIQKQAQSVSLLWSTSSEINNFGFEIERSHDGFAFEKIGQVKGNGTLNNSSNYSYSDQTSNLSLSTYYRVKQVDYDGKFEYSTIQFSPASKENTSILIYPNPLEEGITLFAKFGNDDEGIAKIILSDLSGKMIYTFLTDNIQPNENYAIDDPNLLLTKGEYILSIHTIQNEYIQKLEVK